MQRKAYFMLVLSLLASIFTVGVIAQESSNSAESAAANATTSKVPYRRADSGYSNSASKFGSGVQTGAMATNNQSATARRRPSKLKQRLKDIRRSAADRVSIQATEKNMAAAGRTVLGKAESGETTASSTLVPARIPVEPIRTGLRPERVTAGPSSLRRTARQLLVGQPADLAEKTAVVAIETEPEHVTQPNAQPLEYGESNSLARQPVDMANRSAAESSLKAVENPAATATAITEDATSVLTSSLETSAGSGYVAESLFSSQSPALQVTTSGPHTMVIGKESHYVVTVSNNSNTDAKGVTVDINIPARADVEKVEASQGKAGFESNGEDSGRVRWTMEQVVGQAREKMQISLIPRDSRPFDLSLNWSFIPESPVAQIEVKEPKLEVLLAGPSDILFGASKIYTITVRNPGTGDAENVVLNLLPINRQDVAGVRRLGTMKAGQSERIDVELTAQQPGQIWIRAQAFADNGLRAEVAEEVIVRRASLEVELEAPEVKFAGTISLYELKVTNAGDAIAENVITTAMLPQGAEYVSSGSNAEFDETSGRVSWSLGGVRPGEVRSILLKCILGTPGANRLEVVAEAADNLASFQSAITVVEAMADLKLLVNDPHGPTPIGDEAVYQIHLMNRGSKPAQKIQVYAFFSEGIEPVEIEGGHATIEPGQVVFDNIEQIGAGQEMILKITARAETSGNHMFRAEVTCEDPETELAAQETTRFYGEITPSDTQTTVRPRGGAEVRR